MNNELRKIRYWMLFFIISLVASGATAIPAEAELSFLINLFPVNGSTTPWLQKIVNGIRHTNDKYPFIAYGYDWLAFAHFVLAILFIGPYKDPVKNKWVVEFGIIACFLVFPYAFIAGYFRGIPIGWRLVDCSFGAIGLIPLGICLGKIKHLETFKENKL